MPTVQFFTKTLTGRGFTQTRTRSKPMSSVQSWRERLYIIIFQTDTQAGRRFDTALLLVILASLAVVMLDSIDGIHRQHAGLLAGIEWAFTLGSVAISFVAAPEPVFARGKARGA